MSTPSTGWICPKCSAVYGPHVDECKRCAPLRINLPITLPSEPLPVLPSLTVITINPMTQRCAFDGLPPGVYGLVCNCPRCAPWCGPFRLGGDTTTAVSVPPVRVPNTAGPDPIGGLRC